MSDKHKRNETHIQQNFRAALKRHPKAKNKIDAVRAPIVRMIAINELAATTAGQAAIDQKKIGPVLKAEI